MASKRECIMNNYGYFRGTCANCINIEPVRLIRCESSEDGRAYWSPMCEPCERECFDGDMASMDCVLAVAEVQS